MKPTHLLLPICTAIILAACSSGGSGTSPTGQLADSLTDGVASRATIRVSCELLVGQRSKISVDGNNLSPLNGRWSATVRSGANVASAPPMTGVGDEVEFDFDSNPNDIRAGATPIAANFITISAGLDVTATIANSAGVVIATGGADCETR